MCRRPTTGRGRRSPLRRPTSRRCTSPARLRMNGRRARRSWSHWSRQPPCRRTRPSCWSRPPAAGPHASALKAAVVRAVARMEGGTIAMDAATTAALQKLLEDPATTAAALPIVAKWDKSGALTAIADRQGRALQQEFANPKTSDDRRAELAASLIAVPSADPRPWQRSDRCCPTPPYRIRSRPASSPHSEKAPAPTSMR